MSVYVCACMCVCQGRWMDGTALIVNHCSLCWLSGSGSNGVSIFHYRTMTNEHVNTSTHTQTHTLTHIHLGSQSSLNRPLTVACLAKWGEWTEWHPALRRHRLQTHAAPTPSIHLSLTPSESTDNLLHLLRVALIAASVSSLAPSTTAYNKGLVEPILLCKKIPM